MDLNHIAKKHFNWIDSVGWNNGTVLEKLALVSSEIGEAVDECQGPTPTPEFAIELADIILRVVAISESFSFDIQVKVSLNYHNDRNGCGADRTIKFGSVLEKMSVLTSVLGKAINECRGSEPTLEFATKLAEIIILVILIARSVNIDIEKKVLEKMAVNEKRGTRGRVI